MCGYRIKFPQAKINKVFLREWGIVVGVGAKVKNENCQNFQGFDSRMHLCLCGYRFLFFLCLSSSLLYFFNPFSLYIAYHTFVLILSIFIH